MPDHLQQSCTHCSLPLPCLQALEPVQVSQEAASSIPPSSEIEPAGDRAPPPPPPAAQPGGALPGAMGALPPQHMAAMQQAMQALATGQHSTLLEQVSGKMGVSSDQLRQTAAAIAAGEGDTIPAEVVQRAMQLQWALRAGAVPPMGPAAAAAVPAGVPPGLLGGVHSGHTGMPPGAASHAAAVAAGAAAAGPSPAGHGMLAPGAAAPGAQAPTAGDSLLLDSEDQQGCLELYRRAYGRHLDVVYPPAYVAGASLALSSGLLPFWLALLAVPGCFVLGVQLILIKGVCTG